MLPKDIAKRIIAPTDGTFRLQDYSPAWEGTEEIQFLSGKRLKKRAKDYLEERRKSLIDAQEKLYADDRYSLLIIFQAMDAAGKDGTIKHVMSGVNPQGCQVFSFKQPSAEELDHNFLWRSWRVLPERGRIGIFNRSYYEEVLVVRVHPELVEKQRLPVKADGEDFWNARYEDINAFERHMSRNGTVILKFFLNVSKEEQRRRFIDRLTEPDKLWKFSSGDLHERAHWPEYQEAYQDLIAKTSTRWAPWYVIPADNKWLMRALVMDCITDAITSLDLEFPKISPEQMKEFKQALKLLNAEV
jgi:PPK2 family polyphosphate:nucleotide phosphotransferase